MEERMLPWVGSNSHLQHSRPLHTYMHVPIKSPRQLSAGVGSVRVSEHDKQMKVSAMSSILANTKPHPAYTTSNTCTCTHDRAGRLLL